MRGLGLAFGVVAGGLMGILHIVGTVMLMELAGAVRPIEAVAFTGTKAKCYQNSE